MLIIFISNLDQFVIMPNGYELINNEVTARGDLIRNEIFKVNFFTTKRSEF